MSVLSIYYASSTIPSILPTEPTRWPHHAPDSSLCWAPGTSWAQWYPVPNLSFGAQQCSKGSHHFPECVACHTLLLLSGISKLNTRRPRSYLQAFAHALPSARSAFPFPPSGWLLYILQYPAQASRRSAVSLARVLGHYIACVTTLPPALTSPSVMKEVPKGGCRTP